MPVPDERHVDAAQRRDQAPPLALRMVRRAALDPLHAIVARHDHNEAHATASQPAGDRGATPAGMLQEKQVSVVQPIEGAGDEHAQRFGAGGAAAWRSATPGKRGFLAAGSCDGLLSGVHVRGAL